MSDREVPYWWLIAITTAISIPASIVVGGLALVASGNCDTTCNTGNLTTLGILAAIALALSAVSIVAVVTRSPPVALVSWIAMLVSWGALAAVFLSR